MADQRNESGEITIISTESLSSPGQPLVLVDGKALESIELKDRES